MVQRGGKTTVINITPGSEKEGASSWRPTDVVSADVIAPVCPCGLTGCMHFFVNNGGSVLWRPINAVSTDVTTHVTVIALVNDVIAHVTVIAHVCQ